jgi:hypothetical protein
MRTRRTAAAFAGITLAACLGLTACGSGEPVGNASSFGNISGSAVPVEDELTALCEQIVTQALPADAAAALADASGYEARVVSIDGEAQAVTKDLREDRMNFEIEADIVTGCTVG